MQVNSPVDTRALALKEEAIAGCLRCIDANGTLSERDDKADVWRVEAEAETETGAAAEKIRHQI